MKIIEAFLFIHCAAGIRVRVARESGTVIPAPFVHNDEVIDDNEFTVIGEWDLRFGVAKRWEVATMVDLTSQTVNQAFDNDDGPIEFGRWCWQQDRYGSNFGSEDCLFIGVFAPPQINSTMMPIVFDIHGGFGKVANKQTYNATRWIANKNIVVTSVSYRLNIFGFWSHPSVAQPNLGVTDVVLGLQWVRTYIHLFGGDKSHVTLYGTSFGAYIAQVLNVAKVGVGLFHATWFDAGGAGTNYAFGRTKDELYHDTTKHCMQAANCTDIECMKALPAQDLMNALAGFTLDGTAVNNSPCAASTVINNWVQDDNGVQNNLASFDGIVVPDMKKATCTNAYSSMKRPIVAGYSGTGLDNFWRLGHNLTLYGTQQMDQSLSELSVKGKPLTDKQKTCIKGVMVKEASTKVLHDGVRSPEELIFHEYFFALWMTHTATRVNIDSAPAWLYKMTGGHQLSNFLIWNNTEFPNQGTILNQGVDNSRVFLDQTVKDTPQWIFNWASKQFVRFIKHYKVADPTWHEIAPLSTGDSTVGASLYASMRQGIPLPLVTETAWASLPYYAPFSDLSWGPIKVWMDPAAYLKKVSGNLSSSHLNSEVTEKTQEEVTLQKDILWDLQGVVREVQSWHDIICRRIPPEHAKSCVEEGLAEVNIPDSSSGHLEGEAHLTGYNRNVTFAQMFIQKE